MIGRPLSQLPASERGSPDLMLCALVDTVSRNSYPDPDRDPGFLGLLTKGKKVGAARFEICV
jgi:hypothetical protein